MNPRFVFPLALGFTLTCASCGQEPPKPAAPAVRAQAAPWWGEDVASALKEAKAQNKDALLFFTGSDWAPWAQKLQAEVFDTAEFKAAASKRFVPVILDFPQQKKQGRALMAQNGTWMQKCGIGSFPMVVLADAAGRPYAQFEYQPGAGPADYLKTLDGLRARRVARDEKLAAAAKADGPEKAVLIDDALRALDNNEIVLRHYTAEIKQVIALDPSGLAKGYYERMGKDLLADKKIKELLADAQKEPGKTVDKLVVLGSGEGLSKDVKQRALLYAFRVCQTQLKDNARAEKIFDAALAADPESETTAKLREAKAQLFSGRPENFVELKK